MRTFATVLIIVGILVSLLSANSLQAKAEWNIKNCDKVGWASPRCDWAATYGTYPSRGFLYGLPVIAFGILLLAVRPPDPKR